MLGFWHNLCLWGTAGVWHLHTSLHAGPSICNLNFIADLRISMRIVCWDTADMYPQEYNMLYNFLNELVTSMISLDSWFSSPLLQADSELVSHAPCAERRCPSAATLLFLPWPSLALRWCLRKAILGVLQGKLYESCSRPLCSAEKASTVQSFLHLTK